MATHCVILDDIRFEDHSTSDPEHSLRYPIYGNLICPDVTAEWHKCLQLEPAFRFHPKSADCPKSANCFESTDSFEFHLRLANSDVEFVHESGKPEFCEVAGRPMDCVTNCYFLDNSQACVLVVEPGKWGTSPKVLVIRILCRRKGEEGSGDPAHGVSLVLTVASDVPAVLGRPNCNPPGPNLLPVTVKLVPPPDAARPRSTAKPRRLPSYDIFRSIPLPDGISLELALRFSEFRSDAGLQLQLDDNDIEFRGPRTKTRDEVEVFVSEHFGKIPQHLSMVTRSNPKTAAFTWKHDGFKEPGRVFGFTLGIQSTQGSLGNGLDEAEATIDPIVFNDPPPVPGEHFGAR